MTSSGSLWAALVLATAVNTSVVAGDVVSNQVKSHDIQPSTEATQRTNALRSLAVALSLGSEALRPFRGLRSEDEDNKDRLNPAIPGMECYIDRILSFVSCYSPSIETEEAAALFTRLVDELQAALPSDRWIGRKRAPGIDSIQSYLYADKKSPAHIDVDIVPRLDVREANSYMISMFAWTY
jgi:hypothetical protein